MARIVLILFLTACAQSHARSPDAGALLSDAPPTECVERSHPGTGCLIDFPCWCSLGATHAHCFTCPENCTVPSDCHCYAVGGLRVDDARCGGAL